MTWGNHNAIETIGPNGSPGWGRQWSRYIAEHPYATQSEVFEQFRAMRERFGLTAEPLVPHGWHRRR